MKTSKLLPLTLTTPYLASKTTGSAQVVNSSLSGEKRRWLGDIDTVNHNANGGNSWVRASLVATLTTCRSTTTLYKYEHILVVTQTQWDHSWRVYGVLAVSGRNKLSSLANVYWEQVYEFCRWSILIRRPPSQNNVNGVIY